MSKEMYGKALAEMQHRLILQSKLEGSSMEGGVNVLRLSSGSTNGTSDTSSSDEDTDSEPELKPTDQQSNSNSPTNNGISYNQVNSSSNNSSNASKSVMTHEGRNSPMSFGASRAYLSARASRLISPIVLDDDNIKVSQVIFDKLGSGETPTDSSSYLSSSASSSFSPSSSSLSSSSLSSSGTSPRTDLTTASSPPATIPSVLAIQHERHHRSSSLGKDKRTEFLSKQKEILQGLPLSAAPPSPPQGRNSPLTCSTDSSPSISPLPSPSPPPPPISLNPEVKEEENDTDEFQKKSKRYSSFLPGRKIIEVAKKDKDKDKKDKEKTKEEKKEEKLKKKQQKKDQKKLKQGGSEKDVASTIPSPPPAERPSPFLGKCLLRNHSPCLPKLTSFFS